MKLMNLVQEPPPAPGDPRGGLRAVVRLFYRNRGLGSILLFVFASALGVMMVAGRVMYTGTRGYTFLLWNLILAWIPFLIAFAMYHLRGMPRILRAFGWAMWLLFLPNAPYIVTDLIHLRWNTAAPVWYDAMMIATFAWTGLFLGLVSLTMMQSLVRQRLGNVVSWAFALASLALSGFGIYLGRFERWNSWDILADPRGLGHTLLSKLADPLAHERTYAVTILVTAFLMMAYAMTTTFMLPPAHRAADRES